MSVPKPREVPASENVPQLRLHEVEEVEAELVFSPGSLFRAGDCPPPGLYRQVAGPRTVDIAENGDRLPASFDGHVAVYRRVESLWGQIAEPAQSVPAPAHSFRAAA